VVGLPSFGIAQDLPPLTFTFKDVNVKGAIETDTYAINNKGVITGDYIDRSNVQHGMILNGTRLTTFDNKRCNKTSDRTGISAFGINSAGMVAGWCRLSGKNTDYSFTFAKKKFTTIRPPGSTSTQASGINDKGAVVGSYVDPASNQLGFLKVGGKYTTIMMPGAVTTAATGINDAGIVSVNVGCGGLSSFAYTTLMNSGTFTPYAVPGAGPRGTVIREANTKGDVTGYYFDSASVVHGWLYHGGTYYTFDDPNGANGTAGAGLNDKLNIVGLYFAADNSVHGFDAQAK